MFRWNEVMNLRRLEAEQSRDQICRDFNITLNFVSRLWQQFQDIWSIERKFGQGHPRAPTERIIAILSITIRHNRDTTASQLS